MRVQIALTLDVRRRRPAGHSAVTVEHDTQLDALVERADDNPDAPRVGFTTWAPEDHA